MPADICIHQGEDGTVCGREEVSACPRCGRDIHQRFQYGTCATKGRPHAHPYTPGRKCPTCDGSGIVSLIDIYGNEDTFDCPACADSPVRGYVRAE